MEEDVKCISKEHIKSSLDFWKNKETGFSIEINVNELENKIDESYMVTSYLLGRNLLNKILDL